MSDGATASPKPAGRWPRRIGKSLVVVVLLVVVVRFGGVALLPTLLDRVGARLGLQLTYGRLDLSLIGGSLSLADFDVARRPPDDATAAPPRESLAHLDHLDVEMNPWELLLGRLHVKSVVVSGISASVVRATDGSIGLEGWSPPAAREKEPDEPVDPDEPFDLSLPFTLDALRVDDVAVRFRDDAAGPSWSTLLSLELTVHDVGARDGTTRVQLFARMPGAVESVALAATATTREREATAGLELDVTGVHGDLLERFAADRGIAAAARQLSLGVTARAAVAASDPAGRVLAGSVELPRLQWVADLEPQASVTASVRVGSLTRRAVVVDAVELDVDATAKRLADGALRALGIEVRPKGPDAPKTREAAASPASAKPVAPDVARPPFAVFVREVRPRLALRFRDEAVEPANDLDVALEKSWLRNTSADPTRPDDALTVELHLAAAGAWIDVAGRVVPLAAQRSADLAFVVALPEGLRRFAPYVKAAGVEPTLEDARLAGRVKAALSIDPAGRLAAEATLADVEFTDRGGRDVVLALQELAARGVSIDPAANWIRVEDAAVTGLRLRAAQDERGALKTCGFRTIAAVAADSTTPLDVELTRFEGTLHAFELGGLSDRPPPPESTLTFRAAVSNLCEELSLQCTLASRPGPLDLTADAKLTAKGLRSKPVAGILERAGLAGELEDGALALSLKASVRRDGATLHASTELTKLSLREGASSLVSVESLRVPDVTIAREGTRIARAELIAPVLRVRRDEQGDVHAGGLVFAARRADAAGERGSKPVDGAAPPVPPVPPAPPAPMVTPAPTVSPASPAAFELGEFVLKDLEVDWRDDFVTPVVATSVVVDATLEGLVVNPGAAAKPAALSLDVRIPDALERLEVKAAVSPDPRRLGITADLALDGLRAGPLAAYLPPNLVSTLHDGQLRLHLEAASEAIENGARAVRVELKQLDLRDGTNAEPLLALDRFALTVPRLEWPAGDVEIDELVTSGLKLRVRRGDEGALEALGFVLKPAAKLAKTSAEIVAPEVAPEPRPVAAARPRPASLRIHKLDLGIANLHVDDATHPDLPPLDASLHLFNPAPLTLLSKEPEKLAAIVLRVEGAAEPFVRSLGVDVSLLPFADLPEAEVGIAVDGIHGEQVTRLAQAFPQLADRFDASALADGSFATRAHAVVTVKRRNPTDFDWRGGFGVEVEVRDVALRATPDGPVLAGIERIAVDAASIRLASGDVHVRTIEVTRPVGSLRRTASGLEIAGVLIPQKAPGDASATAPTTPAAEPAKPDESPATSAPPPPEMRIDDLTINGLDFRLIDKTLQPPLDLPLTDLDLEVKHFTTRARTAPRPFEFHVSLSAGDVELRRRDARSLVSGLLSGVVEAVTGTGIEHEAALELRPAWDEIAMSGQLLLYPKPRGSLRLEVTGLELQTFKAAARQAGVEISDGTADTSVEVRMRGDEGLTVVSNTVLTWMSMSEPPNGPIASYLKLPAPVDTVLFLLRDSNSQQRLPMRFAIPADGLDRATLAQLVTTALLRLISDAVKSAPMRIVQGGLDATQLSRLPGVSNVLAVSDLESFQSLFGGDKPPEYTGEPILIPLEPGAPSLPADLRSRLEPLFEQMRDDDSITLVVEHELGSDDIAQVRRSSAPSPAECAELATRLRSRRAEVAARRETVAADARSRFASGRATEAARLIDEVRALDRAAADVEEAIDRALELTGRTNARANDRRARAACLTLADLRIEAARALLLDAGVKRMAQRFEIKRVRIGVRPDDTAGCLVIRPRKRR